MEDLVIIAGPCSVESRRQLDMIACEIEPDTDVLRGGTYKVRTSPDDFQGLGREGIGILEEVGRRYALPTVSEVVDCSIIDEYSAIDILQIGARNMQNVPLLKAAGRSGKPVILKRGFGNTVDELLKSAEYIRREGNENVILCERGIRSFEDATRATLDIAAIPICRREGFRVFADPSHAAGRRDLVEPLALAAVAAGADGLIIEVHNDPCRALSDGPQSVLPEEFHRIVSTAKKIAEYGHCDIK